MVCLRWKILGVPYLALLQFNYLLNSGIQVHERERRKGLTRPEDPKQPEGRTHPLRTVCHCDVYNAAI